MKNIVYFDSGTSNTRIYVIDGSFRVTYTAKEPFGSKDVAILGENTKLLQTLNKMYRTALEKLGITDGDVDGIFASGMVTSPYGIFETPHVCLPVSVKEFAASIRPYFEDRFFKRDICLVPGLKTEDENFYFRGNVRGEEIETFGAMDDIDPEDLESGAIVMLPGSHTHAIYIKDRGLKGIASNFTGELFHCLKEESVLAPILSYENYEEELDKEMVKQGCQNLNEFGFNRALYIGHAMRIFDEHTAAKRFSYCEGVLNGGMRQAIEVFSRERWNGCKCIYVLGNSFNYKLMSFIFDGSDFGELKWLRSGDGDDYSVKGLIRILKEQED